MKLGKKVLSIMVSFALIVSMFSLLTTAEAARNVNHEKAELRVVEKTEMETIVGRGGGSGDGDDEGDDDSNENSGGGDDYEYENYFQNSKGDSEIPDHEEFGVVNADKPPLNQSWDSYTYINYPLFRYDLKKTNDIATIEVQPDETPRKISAGNEVEETSEIRGEISSDWHNAVAVTAEYSHTKTVSNSFDVEKEIDGGENGKYHFVYSEEDYKVEEGDIKRYSWTEIDGPYLSKYDVNKDIASGGEWWAHHGSEEYRIIESVGIVYDIMDRCMTKSNGEFPDQEKLDWQVENVRKYDYNNKNWDYDATEDDIRSNW